MYFNLLQRFLSIILFYWCPICFPNIHVCFTYICSMAHQNYMILLELDDIHMQCWFLVHIHWYSAFSNCSFFIIIIILGFFAKNHNLKKLLSYQTWNWKKFVSYYILHRSQPPNKYWPVPNLLFFYVYTRSFWRKRSYAPEGENRLYM